MAAGVPSVVPQLELGVFLLIGVLGGAHCLGMCGPLVTMYATRMGDDGPVSFHDVRQHLLFGFGRTTAYAFVGGVMGGLGMVLFDAAAVADAANGVRAVVGVAVGLLIVVAGISYLRGGAGGPLARLEGAGGVVGRVTDRVDEWVDGPRMFLLGAAHSLFPCPLLYPAYLYALARGDPFEGALALGVLGVGTIPWLFTYGTAVGAAPARWLSRVHRVLGVAFIVLGYIPLSHGLSLLGVPIPMPPVHEFIYQPLDVIVDTAKYCLPA